MTDCRHCCTANVNDVYHLGPRAYHGDYLYCRCLLDYDLRICKGECEHYETWEAYRKRAEEGVGLRRQARSTVFRFIGLLGFWGATYLLVKAMGLPLWTLIPLCILSGNIWRFMADALAGPLPEAR